MVELLTPSIWAPRLIVIALWISCVSCQNLENWDRKFAEMKTMMTQLDSKMSSIDLKLNSLNFLEYAFTVNTIDNSIKNLNSKVDQMTTQMDSIKESVRALSSSSCPQAERAQNVQQARGSPSDDGKQVVVKLDDYGKKLIQSHQDIKAASEEHQQSLTSFVDVVRTGFTKVISKVDSLLALEGQMSAIVPLVRQLSATTNFISDEVSSVGLSITEVKKDIADLADASKALPQVVTNLIGNDVSNEITKMARGLENLTNTNMALSEFVTEVQNSVSFPVSQLQQAVAEAKGLQLEMSRLTSIEEKVGKAASLSSSLLAKESLNSLPAEDKEIAQNLTKSLSEIESATVPLFLSLTYNFDHIKAVISDSFATIANRTQCHLDETMKLEIQRLRDGISKSQSVQASNSGDVFDYCRETIQDMVMNETPNLRMPLLKLLSHLKVLAEVDGSLYGSNSDSQNLDKPLRILLG